MSLEFFCPGGVCYLVSFTVCTEGARPQVGRFKFVIEAQSSAKSTEIGLRNSSIVDPALTAYPKPYA